MTEPAKRVVFSFDGASFANLEQIRDRGRYPNLAGAVRDALRTVKALQEHRDAGFTEVVVRNPETGAERVLDLGDGGGKRP